MKWAFQSPPWRAAPLMTPAALAICLGAGALSCTVVPDDEYCASDEDCAPRGENLLCDEVRHECQEVPVGGCRRDEACGKVDRPLCDRDSSTCVPCVPSGDGRPSPACAHFDPPQPFCVQPTGASATRCAECLSNADCPVQRPICDGNLCRPCREHKECGPEVRCDDGTDNVGKPCKNSWVCMSAEDGDDLKARAGRCAMSSGSTSRVVYAQNFPGNCKDDWPGTPDQPRCSMDKAVERAVAEPTRFRYLRLLGTIFEPLATPLGKDVRLVLVGAETRTLPRAEVRGNKVLFQITGGASVILDSIKMTQDKASTTLVSCKSGGTATSFVLRRSALLGATTVFGGVDAAVDSTDCDAQLLLNYVGAQEEGQPAHSLGVKLQGGSARSYRLVGNVIAGNQGPALSLVPANLDLRFNTIVGNGGMAGVSGAVDCQFGTVARVGQSIIAGNTLSGVSQFNSNCSFTFDQVVAGPAEMIAGVDRAAPSLDKRFHLTPQSAACLDKAPQAAGFPDRDIDGDVRPQGDKLDLGADEFKP